MRAHRLARACRYATSVALASSEFEPRGLLRRGLGLGFDYAANPPKLGSAPCGLSVRPFGSSQSSCRPSADKSRMP